MENDADLPRRIGVCTVERELGAGGMGTVCLARSRGGRAVAVNRHRRRTRRQSQARTGH